MTAHRNKRKGPTKTSKQAAKSSRVHSRSKLEKLNQRRKPTGDIPKQGGSQGHYIFMTTVSKVMSEERTKKNVKGTVHGHRTSESDQPQRPEHTSQRKPSQK